jgi:hypothetical protein
VGVGEGVDVEVAAGVRVVVGVDETAAGEAVLWISPQDANKNTPKSSRQQTKRDCSHLDRKKRYRPSPFKDA